MCMNNNLDTADRIADAALRVLARRGLRKLSMTDIGDEARVSRGTLYRYFASREDVLAAAEERVVSTLEQALDEAVAANPRPGERVAVVFEALSTHRTQHPALAELVRDQPRLVLDFFAREFDTLLDLLARSLQPVLARTAAVRTGAMSERQVAEVLLRVALTADVISAPGSEWLGSQAADLWTSLLAPQGTARPRARVPREAELARAS
jgi:AcrR family transcriptional regulator